MTIIFRAPDAPFRVVAPFPSEPDYTEQRSDLPELMVDSEHRPAFLRLLRLAAGHDGRIRVDEMDSLLGRLTTLIDEDGGEPGDPHEAQSLHVSHHGRVLTQDHEAPFIAAHLTGQRQRRYMQGLVQLLRRARHGCHAVIWSRPEAA